MTIRASIVLLALWAAFAQAANRCDLQEELWAEIAHAYGTEYSRGVTTKIDLEVMTQAPDEVLAELQALRRLKGEGRLVWMEMQKFDAEGRLFDRAGSISGYGVEITRVPPGRQYDAIRAALKDLKNNNGHFLISKELMGPDLGEAGAIFFSERSLSVPSRSRSVILVPSLNQMRDTHVTHEHRHFLDEILHRRNFLRKLPPLPPRYLRALARYRAGKGFTGRDKRLLERVERLKINLLEKRASMGSVLSFLNPFRAKRNFLRLQAPQSYTILLDEALNLSGHSFALAWRSLLVNPRNPRHVVFVFQGAMGGAVFIVALGAVMGPVGILVVEGIRGVLY